MSKFDARQCSKARPRFISSSWLDGGRLRAPATYTLYESLPKAKACSPDMPVRAGWTLTVVIRPAGCVYRMGVCRLIRPGLILGINQGNEVAKLFTRDPNLPHDLNTPVRVFGRREGVHKNYRQFDDAQDLCRCPVLLPGEVVTARLSCPHLVRRPSVLPEELGSGFTH